jgi:hypothetical protein
MPQQSLKMARFLRRGRLNGNDDLRRFLVPRITVADNTPDSADGSGIVRIGCTNVSVIDLICIGGIVAISIGILKD